MHMLKLYILTGMPYSGKSTLACELIKRFDFEYASVDDEISKGSYDVTRMNQQDWNDVYARAYGRLEQCLRSGKTTIFDGASLKRRERQNLRNIATKCGAEPVLVYVNTPPDEIIRRRLKNMTTGERAHLQDETMAKAGAMFEQPGEDEQPIVYDASSMEIEGWLKKYIPPSGKISV